MHPTSRPRRPRRHIKFVTAPKVGIKRLYTEPSGEFYTGDIRWLSDIRWISITPKIFGEEYAEGRETFASVVKSVAKSARLNKKLNEELEDLVSEVMKHELAAIV